MYDGPAYTADTNGVLVRVRPSYLVEESDPYEGHWVWSYQIEIVNLTTETVQLISRRWTIVDATGKIEQVAGPGVVGEQPVIAPGDSFTYVSGCPLKTESGSMAGVYYMVAEDGRRFEAEIPAFSLDSPFARRTLN